MVTYRLSDWNRLKAELLRWNKLFRETSLAVQ